MTSKINVTVAQAYKYLEGIRKLESLEVNVPVEVGFPIIENISRIDQALKPSIELRNKTILKYSKGNGQINQSENPEEYKACCNELDKLGNMEIELSIVMVDANKLHDIDLPMWAFFALSFMSIGGN